MLWRTYLQFTEKNMWIHPVMSKCWLMLLENNSQIGCCVDGWSGRWRSKVWQSYRPVCRSLLPSGILRFFRSFDDFHHFDFLMKFILLLILPFSLQRFINRTKPPISKEQQQNLTRWAVSPRLQSVHLGLFSNNLIPTKQQWNLLQVLFAASLLKTNVPTHEALVAAMSKKASVLECMEAIENAA